MMKKIDLETVVIEAVEEVEESVEVSEEKEVAIRVNPEADVITSKLMRVNSQLSES
jgi:hypothetical protein